MFCQSPLGSHKRNSKITDVSVRGNGADPLLKKMYFFFLARKINRMFLRNIWKTVVNLGRRDGDALSEIFSWNFKFFFIAPRNTLRSVCLSIKIMQPGFKECPTKMAETGGKYKISSIKNLPLYTGYFAAYTDNETLKLSCSSFVYTFRKVSLLFSGNLHVN